LVRRRVLATRGMTMRPLAGAGVIQYSNSWVVLEDRWSCRLIVAETRGLRKHLVSVRGD
jgi:hypothetical protein